MQNLATNPVRESLDNNESVVGTVAKQPSPAMIELFGEIGLDFAFIDLEHGGPSPFNSEFLESLWRGAVIGGVEPLVRLPSGDPPLVRRVLDTGIRSIIIPRVTSGQEVQEAVKASRFQYEDSPGERGFVSGCQANMWGAELDDYLETSDSTSLVGVIIETAEAVDNIQDILSVPNLGFVFIGRRDLTISLGHRNDIHHSDVEEAVSKVHSASMNAGVPIGTVASEPSEARSKVGKGYQIILNGYEFDAIRSYYSRWLDEYYLQD